MQHVFKLIGKVLFFNGHSFMCVMENYNFQPSTKKMLILEHPKIWTGLVASRVCHKWVAQEIFNAHAVVLPSPAYG